MPAKNVKRIDDEGTLIHIYNKGVGGNVIFKNDDFKVFINFLGESLTTPKRSAKQVFQVRGLPFKGTPRLPKNYHNQVELIAYNLKPDHFHLIIRQVSRGSVEKFLRSLCTRYSMYFNKKYGRIGSLFVGPYKSAQIKDRESLELLTRYLHSEGGYSSYSEYLGERTNSWVNKDLVLAGFKAGVSYKDFVEKSKDDKGIVLKSILLDDNSDRLDRREPVIATNVVTKSHSGLPRFLVVSGSIFILLTSVGLGNILTSSSKSKAPLPSLATLSVSEAKPRVTVKVKLEDESAFVNIRQRPTTSSLKIGSARNGDIFEFISLQSGWYEVKLATTSGFITSQYIEEQTNND